MRWMRKESEEERIKRKVMERAKRKERKSNE